MENVPIAMGSEQDRYRIISMSIVNLNMLDILLRHRKQTAMYILECKDEDTKKLLIEMLKMEEQEIKNALILE